MAAAIPEQDEAPQAVDLACTQEEIMQLRTIAESRTVGIWKSKRARAILGRLEEKTIGSLVSEVRVPPESIIRCLQEFSSERINYFDNHVRRPTSREAPIEKILLFLEHPPEKDAKEWDRLRVTYLRHTFTAAQIKTLREKLSSTKFKNKRKLFDDICLHFGLRKGDSSLNIELLRLILRRMDMDNLVYWRPVKRKPNLTTPSQSIRDKARCYVREELPKKRVDPDDVAVLQFEALTKTTFASGLWYELMDTYHYIGGKGLVGRQMRYLIYGKPRNAPAAEKGVLLAALGFAQASWHLAPRDRYIGWNQEQRTKNAKLIINNTRFLILPWIECPNLASRILGGIARQLPLDWEKRYAFRPVLLETFVQDDLFHGTCYKAANWKFLGVTEGYSYYGWKRLLIPEKSIYVYPLEKKFRQKLCS